MTYMQSTLWQRAFCDAAWASHQDQREYLKNAYLALRKQAETLVANIGADLRQYTVHDITHLDALWGVASEIVGSDIDLTPTEGFILGASFLLHDAGMCLSAYPGGLEELKKHRLWFSNLRRVAQNIDAPTEAEISSAIVELIRSEHANRARELPSVEWMSPSGGKYYLIESADIRQKFSNAIGDVAASHWWNHDRLAAELDRILPAPPPFPIEWRADLLKIAAILRVADAAHIDERRAPGFLWALRGSSLSDISNLHWLFQNRITQPERRDDALYYSSTSDFISSEADSWWLANDTLRMIDRELRSTDVLLADLRGNKVRLSARRVANVESTATMVSSIRVRGWIPIDTTIKISDIPNLIRTLGGEALYGESASVPLRELLQNAADAIRLKSAVLPGFLLRDGLIEVRIGADSGGSYLQVTDNGVGMTREVLGGAFLDFGNSGWSNDPIFSDYPGIDPRNLNVIGKFGIGFFSVFMLGEKIEVITRRFDKGFQDTLVLSFSGGVGKRPILRQGLQSEWLEKGGTSIKVWIKDDAKMFKKEDVTLGQICEKNFPLSDVKMRASAGGITCDVESIDWRSVDPESLLKRVNQLVSLPDVVRPYVKNLRPIYDPSGSIAGRMFVTPAPYSLILEDGRWMNSELSGVVVSRGVYVSSINGIQGIVESDIRTADRRSAWPKPSKEEFRRWSAEQAELIASMGLSGAEEAACAAVVRCVSGDAGDLRFIRTREEFLSCKQFRDMAIRLEQIKITSGFEIKELKRINPRAVLDECLVGAEAGRLVVFSGQARARSESFDDFLIGRRSDDRGDLISILGDCWGFDGHLIAALKRGEIEGKRISRNIVLARTASGEEILGHGVHCWKGMSLDDVKRMLVN